MVNVRRLPHALLIIGLTLLSLFAFHQIARAQNAAGNTDTQTNIANTDAAAADVQTQADAPVGDETHASPVITFPIADLGNCKDKTSCKAYCDVVSHIDACVAFALAHGLMKSGEATAAHTFAKTLQQDGGPGGCTDPKSCKAYCDNTAHLEECIAFAQKTGANDQGLQQGLKIAAYLKSGGTLPGNCSTPDSCRAYCSTLTHIAECQAFAKAAGISAPDQQDHNDQLARKLQELAQSGQTPGGCTSKDECEAYCSDQSHADECLAFGEKAGIVSESDAQQARSVIQGGGPGGCKNPDECRTFCSSPDNRQICIQFAQQQGLITQEQAQQFTAAQQQIQQFGHLQNEQGQTQSFGSSRDEQEQQGIPGQFRNQNGGQFNGQPPQGQLNGQGAFPPQEGSASGASGGEGPEQGMRQSFFGKFIGPMQSFFGRSHNPEEQNMMPNISQDMQNNMSQMGPRDMQNGPNGEQAGKMMQGMPIDKEKLQQQFNQLRPEMQAKYQAQFHKIMNNGGSATSDTISPSTMPQGGTQGAMNRQSEMPPEGTGYQNGTQMQPPTMPPNGTMPYNNTDTHVGTYETGTMPPGGSNMRTMSGENMPPPNMPPASGSTMPSGNISPPGGSPPPNGGSMPLPGGAAPQSSAAPLMNLMVADVFNAIISLYGFR